MPVVRHALISQALPSRFQALLETEETRALLERTFSCYFEDDQESLPIHIVSQPIARIRAQHIRDIIFALLVCDERLKLAKKKRVVAAALADSHALLAVFRNQQEMSQFMKNAGAHALNIEGIVLDEIVYEASTEYLFGKRDSTVRKIVSLILRCGICSSCRKIYEEIRLAESSAINKGVYKVRQLEVEHSDSSVAYDEEEKTATAEYFIQGVEIYLGMWQEWVKDEGGNDEEEAIRFSFNDRIGLEKQDPLLADLLQGMFGELKCPGLALDLQLDPHAPDPAVPVSAESILGKDQGGLITAAMGSDIRSPEPPQSPVLGASLLDFRQIKHARVLAELHQTASSCVKGHTAMFTVQLHENQRRLPFGSYSTKFLYASEKNLTHLDMTGTYKWKLIPGDSQAVPDVDPPPGWHWDPGSKWQIDQKGWQYSYGFGYQFGSSSSMKTFVRRRLWRRVIAYQAQN